MKSPIKVGVLAAVFVLVSGCGNLARAEIPKNGGDAYAILLQYLRTRPNAPHGFRLERYIVCKDRYFFPLRVPLFKAISERGYYVNPTTRQVEFVDRPWNDVRKVMTGWESRGRDTHEKVTDKTSAPDNRRSAPRQPPEGPPPAKPGSAPK